MASLKLDPNATAHELYRAREACSFALRWLLGSECPLPADVRAERIDDLVDAVRIHDRALEALYSRCDERPVPRRSQTSRRRLGRRTRQA
jgi:hypothetical protein